LWKSTFWTTQEKVLLEFVGVATVPEAVAATDASLDGDPDRLRAEATEDAGVALKRGDAEVNDEDRFQAVFGALDALLPPAPIGASGAVAATAAAASFPVFRRWSECTGGDSPPSGVSPCS
jgi:hypothetical protein